MRELKLYRCPACGNYYDVLTVESDAFYGNSTNYWHTLSRHRPHSHADLGHPEAAVDAARLLTLDCFKVGDLQELDRLLLRHTDPAVRLVALNTLAMLFDPGYDQVRGSGAPALSTTRCVELGRPFRNEAVALDLTVLEPTLRELLKESSDLARSGAGVLARHLLRQERQAEVTALFKRRNIAVRRGALNAVWHAATGWWAEVGRFLGPVRDFLGDEDKQARSNAQEILGKLRYQKGGAAADTVEDATRRLKSALAEERKAAASVLAELADAGEDIGAALRRLAALLRSGATAEAAIKAIWNAAIAGTNVRVTLPALAQYLESTSRPIGGAIGILIAHQERGGDISRAFGALGKLALAGNSHELELLKQAAESGADLTAAIEPLQGLVTKANLAPQENASSIGYWGDTAARILTLHYARAHAWADVALLLGGANPRVRGGAVSALRDLSTGYLRGLAPDLDLSPVLPDLRKVASAEEGWDRDTARSVLKEIPVATDRGWTWGEPPELQHIEIQGDQVLFRTDGDRGGTQMDCTVEEFLAGRLSSVLPRPVVAQVRGALAGRKT